MDRGRERDNRRFVASFSLQVIFGSFRILEQFEFTTMEYWNAYPDTDIESTEDDKLNHWGLLNDPKPNSWNASNDSK